MKGDQIFFKLTRAHRVLAIFPGLDKSDRLVGAALLAHFNTKNGRCDPGIDKLVNELGMHRASVFRALNRLTKRTGLDLFKRQTYGGRRHCNNYLPLWDRFEDLAQKMANWSRHATVKPSHQETGVPSHQETPNDNSTTKNPSTESQTVLPRLERSNGQARGSEPIQLHLTHLLPGGKSASHRDVAMAAEQRRQAHVIAALPNPRQREAAWLVAMNDQEFSRSTLPPSNNTPTTLRSS